MLSIICPIRPMFAAFCNPFAMLLKRFALQIQKPQPHFHQQLGALLKRFETFCNAFFSGRLHLASGSPTPGSPGPWIPAPGLPDQPRYSYTRGTAPKLSRNYASVL